MTTASVASLLRLEVGRLRAHESHGYFDTVVHLGWIGTPHVTCTVSRADLPVLDACTRCEVVTRLLEEDRIGNSSSVWLTRAGEPELQDGDLAWLAAVSRAFGALRRRLDGLWIITRTGWLDVRTGDSRTWKRLRL